MNRSFFDDPKYSKKINPHGKLFNVACDCGRPALGHRYNGKYYCYDCMQEAWANDYVFIPRKKPEVNRVTLGLKGEIESD
jgi:hypothetical protein